MPYRQLLCIIALFGLGRSSAQNYVPFPTDNAEWITARYVYLNVNQSTTTFSAYRLLGDTLVNDTVYHKLYETSQFEPNASRLVAGLREEDKRIYARRFDYLGLLNACQWTTDVDVMLYDYNLDGPGDSLIIQHPSSGEMIFIVQSVDSVQVDGAPRRRLNLENVTFNCGTMPLSYIEGVGSARHVMDPFMQQDYEHVFNLSCFKTDGVFRYSAFPDPPLCDLATVGIDANGESVKNPLTARMVNDELLVNCPAADRVRVLDALGRMVADLSMRGGQVAIPVQEWSGIVFVQGWMKGRALGAALPVALAR